LKDEREVKDKNQKVKGKKDSNDINATAGK
jgi:hypothetical protein